MLLNLDIYNSADFALQTGDFPLKKITVSAFLLHVFEGLHGFCSKSHTSIMFPSPGTAAIQHGHVALELGVAQPSQRSAPRGTWRRGHGGGDDGGAEPLLGEAAQDLGQIG